MSTVRPVTIQDAVDWLYRLAVTEQKPTSTKRLDKLAEFCISELASRGLHDAVADVHIPGGGRTKEWDVAWQFGEKYRLAISLKSLLRNLPGTVPNRVDDLIGEVTNLQMYSPEIVAGYVMLFDVSTDVVSTKHRCTWEELLRRRFGRVTGRHGPSWGVGMIEASLVVSVDFSSGPDIVSDKDEIAPFFDCLVSRVRERNPATEGLGV